MVEYYTPELEEFHIGFEYEHLDSICKSWNKYTLDRDIISNDSLPENPLDCEESGEQYRVKYLDKEDIESLGFRILRNTSLEKYFPKMVSQINSSEDDIYISENPSKKFKFAILRQWKDNRISISVTDDESSALLTVVNTYTCKNKSKLKSLLKDVGIL